MTETVVPVFLVRNKEEEIKITFSVMIVFFSNAEMSFLKAFHL